MLVSPLLTLALIVLIWTGSLPAKPIAILPLSTMMAQRRVKTRDSILVILDDVRVLSLTFEAQLIVNQTMVCRRIKMRVL